MNFKKIIACILAFAMLLSAFGAYADSSRNAREDEIYRSMDILRTFGFIPDYYDYNVNPETAATRADFAVSRINGREGRCPSPWIFNMPASLPARSSAR